MLSLCCEDRAVSLYLAKTTPANVTGDLMSVLRDIDEIEIEISKVRRKATTLNDELLLFLLDMATRHTKNKGIAALLKTESAQSKTVECHLKREIIH